MPSIRIECGDVREVLQKLEAGSINSVITSPPYWNLRSYGTSPLIWGGSKGCDHGWRIQKRAGLSGGLNEWSKSRHRGQDRSVVPETEQAFCQKCDAWRGSLGLEPTLELYTQNLVEIFRGVRRVLRDDGTVWLNMGDCYAANRSYQVRDSKHVDVGNTMGMKVPDGLKPKDLVGLPWRVAFALQADGWYLRSDIIWCLSGSTRVYARAQKGEMPMTIKDLARLRPDTVELWNGYRWTRLLGVSRSPRLGTELEIVLRSGECISCTPAHRFPTSRGLLNAESIRVGDILNTVTLPDAEKARDCALDTDAAWLAGLYIAEGSRSGSTIQIAGHSREIERWERVRRVAAKYGGSATVTISGNCQAIRVYGRVLNAIVDELVTGRTAKNKGFASVVWRYSNDFVAAMVDGYLSGDGSYDAENNRWRLGFTRNYHLEHDLRTACARLDYHIVLNLSSVPYKGRRVGTFRGEIRKARTGHHNEKAPGEVVEIRRAHSHRNFYNLGVVDDPHLFALASGVLTRNSKPNVMPSSVTDRPTSSHEYIFLLSKNKTYYYDNEAIREPAIHAGRIVKKYPPDAKNAQSNLRTYRGFTTHDTLVRATRNKRSVWSINSQAYKGAHFATFPEKLVEPCVLAGSPEGGVILDPFMGSGTVLVVARRHGRDSIGIELNAAYIELAKKRLGM